MVDVSKVCVVLADGLLVIEDVACGDRSSFLFCCFGV